jgi:hypothetical protein
MPTHASLQGLIDPAAVEQKQDHVSSQPQHAIDDTRHDR